MTVLAYRDTTTPTRTPAPPRPTRARRGPVRLLPASAPRQVWLAERRRGIGGSDALAVMGLSPHSSAYQVWADKCGLLPAARETEAMLWGRLLEQVIARHVATELGLTVRRAGLHAHPEHPWMRYTPDRLTSDGGLLEIKTTTLFRAEEWRHDSIPEHAEAQARHGMAVLGRGHAWIAGLIGGQHLALRRITRDRVFEANMIAIERSFWHDHVQARRPPHPDGSASCSRTLYELYQKEQAGQRVVLDEQDLAVLEELAGLKARAKQLKTSIAEAENWIKHRLGTAEIGTTPDGEPVVAWRARQRSGYTVKPTAYRQLDLLRTAVA
ncbi:putative phage-type endonuclease [Crossiella equi]|uniref:Phage-type endonuclease n=1 Tax=Crossiella equi TaxID=130796 RepID=A0ABS5AM59_9PSEU|nr:YqaJ viral recombinase family protein [Crossiella equi]MBP2477646.1 putative phage-type endonuclease [Crossiella equi]